ncbi:MAG: hypothetical protein HQL97_08015 [Magnetococcales bacterium]|nr:hypothetical protein [Magnetococcales bacterium]MBF0261760.1 hypothetical protein [Magnetococcales bacterium]
MSREIQALQDKVNFLRQTPHVYDIVTTHCGVKDLTNLKGINPSSLQRVQRYVDYYYGIFAYPY